jgi:small subunit ribosomal protein S9
MTADLFAWGTGRRKTSIARVRLRKGTGVIMINGRTLDRYFLSEQDRGIILAPLQATKTTGKYDVLASVRGGGVTGQAGALRLGLTRALRTVEPALDAKLREEGFTTRDPRMKERKKYGRRGARRGVQWTKR